MRLHQCTERALRVVTHAARNWISTYYAQYDPHNDVASTRARKNATEQCALTGRIDAQYINKYKSATYRRNAEDNNSHLGVLTRTMSLVVYRHGTYGTTLIRDASFYRERPGRSPTVNVSWFIAKAYLANLFYTQRHYKQRLQFCVVHC